MKNVQNALRKVLVPLNHFVHRIVLLIAQISMMAMVAGMAPASRIAASTLWATSIFCG